MSRVVTEMERQGLVRREANATDGRSTLALITPEGRRRLRAAAPAYLTAIEEHFSRHLTATDQRAVTRALAKVFAKEQGSG